MGFYTALKSLETLVDKGVTKSGQDFFDIMTVELATALSADVIFIGKLIYPQRTHIQTLSRCIDGELVDNKVYELKNTPCEEVVGKSACSFPDDVQEQFPEESFLNKMEIVGYLGVPLFSSHGVPMGHVVALYKEPIPDERLARVIVQLFSARLGAEIERQNLTDELEQSTLLFESIVRNMIDYLIIFNNKGDIKFTSKSVNDLELILGSNKLSSFYDFFDEQTTLAIEQDLANLTPANNSISYELHLEADNKTKMIQWNVQGIFNDEGKILYFETIGRDFTDLVESEEARANAEFMLNHSEKMSAIGKLAGGVAHDFNNQLTGIKGYSELIINLCEDEKIRKYAENIHKSAERSADISQQLLSFSRKDAPETKETDIHEIINEVFELVSHSMDKKVKLSSKLTAHSHTVTADTSQIQNAIMNMVINAKDAIKDEGNILIETYDESYSAKQIHDLGTELPAGNYLRINIIDDGSGIEQAIIRRVFEPFFTTKEIGKGTGIGLNAVYNTFINQKGFVWVESTVGKGTQFNIILPVCSKQTEKVNENNKMTDQNNSNSYQILLVDDEPMVLEVSTLMLESLGHEVTAFSSPQDAIDNFKDNSDHYHLAIIDMVMPEMTGKELYMELTSIRSDIPTAISSGYQMNEKDEDLMAIGIKGFINKPFSLDILSKSLHELVS